MGAGAGRVSTAANMNNTLEAKMTHEADMQEEARQRHGVKFDGTVNLGHILTMLVMVGSGASMYFSLDKRISKQEDMAPFVQSSRDAQDARVQTQLQTLSSDVKEVKSSVDKMSLAVQVQREVTSATKGSK